MKRKALLLDIDYTVHDNAKFKLLLCKDLKKRFNLPYQRVLSLYQNVLAESRYFKPELFINTLSKELGDKYKKEIGSVLWLKARFDKTVYPDTKTFLKKLTKSVNIYIFSKGDKKFQTNKIQPLIKLIKFKKTIILKNKLSKLGQIIRGIKENQIFLVDDSPEIVNQAKKINKNIVAILIKRRNYNKNYDYQKSVLADYKVTNLTSAAKIIESY